MALSIAYWRQNAVTPKQQQKHLAACSLERGGVAFGSFQGYSIGAKIGLDFRKGTMRRFKKVKRPSGTGRMALHGS
ncbi:hypothetical protein [Agrobacterium cavarae]|uniref:hypothetical protein n=1 Tax=Agrobacterium cavarae TaxID=2528239 RepID=UPI003FD3A134